MYIGSYHRAARRAADAISTPGDRIMILSYAGTDVSGHCSTANFARTMSDAVTVPCRPSGHPRAVCW